MQKTSMKRKLLSFWLGAAALTQADTLILKNGRHLEGTYLGGDARTVKFDANDHIAAYAVSDLEDIRFSSGASPTGVSAVPQASAPVRPTIQIMTNTPIIVRLIDPIRSDDAAPGAIYRTSVDTPIY